MPSPFPHTVCVMVHVFEGSLLTVSLGSRLHCYEAEWRKDTVEAAAVLDSRKMCIFLFLFLSTPEVGIHYLHSLPGALFPEVRYMITEGG